MQRLLLTTGELFRQSALSTALLASLVMAQLAALPAAGAAATKPNILVILADDLGYGDVQWPREADAPLTGVPPGDRAADAQLDDKPVRELLYRAGGAMKALPVARVQLKVGSSVQEAAVRSSDKCTTFTTKVDAGSADIEATLLDESGKALCSAYYVSIRRATGSKP